MDSSWRTWLQAAGALAFGYVAALLTFWLTGDSWGLAARNAALSLVPSVIALLAKNPFSGALTALGITAPAAQPLPQLPAPAEAPAAAPATVRPAVSTGAPPPAKPPPAKWN